MNCINCNSKHIQKRGSSNGKQRYYCKECNSYFTYGNYEPAYTTYFNIKIKNENKIKLTRENYCVPSNKTTISTQRYIDYLIDRYKDNKDIAITIPNEVFEDKYHYTDEWVNKHYKDCMLNFDLNMKYFDSLNSLDFTKTLDSFVSKFKFTETFDLNEVDNVSGIYILVLDQYKQVYIGKSDNIKKRIQSHWTKKKEFSRLIWGNVNTSIISIDSFGALDTTRIFLKAIDSYELDRAEEKYVKKFKSEYLLNRVSGGINDYDDRIRNMELIATSRTRKLK